MTSDKRNEFLTEVRKLQDETGFALLNKFEINEWPYEGLRFDNDVPVETKSKIEKIFAKYKTSL